VLEQWAYRYSVALNFSRPGKPPGDAYVESFKGNFRDECSNVSRFLSLEDARGKIKSWRPRYNENRPHTVLCDVLPKEFTSNGGAGLAIAGSARSGIFVPSLELK
jgi:putative transposase